jgi:hypothetical protein
MGKEGGSAVPDDYEIAVDYMDMTNDRHLWAGAADARPGLELSVGARWSWATRNADPKVARIARACSGRMWQGLGRSWAARGWRTSGSVGRRREVALSRTSW